MRRPAPRPRSRSPAARPSPRSAAITEPKGEFLYHTGVKAGAATTTLLEGIVAGSLERLPIAKRMRWGGGTAEFVRPVHWVVLLYGREVVPARILGIVAGDRTRGHRFMAPREIVLRTPASYAARLEKRGQGASPTSRSGASGSGAASSRSPPSTAPRP